MSRVTKEIHCDPKYQDEVDKKLYLFFKNLDSNFPEYKFGTNDGWEETPESIVTPAKEPKLKPVTPKPFTPRRRSR
jgi:hypothetical protein